MVDLISRLSPPFFEKKIWCRVDDVWKNSDSFKKILELHDCTLVPLTLSVIPEKLTSAVRDEIVKRSQLTVVQHGYSHRNYHTQKCPSELGSARPLIETLDELMAGKEQLLSLFPLQFVPLIVPPWHHISHTLIQALTAIGFKALSLHDKTPYVIPKGLKRLNIHTDPIRWKPTIQFKKSSSLIAEIDSHLKHSNEDYWGVVAHPEYHDRECWFFFEQLFMNNKSVKWFNLKEEM